MAAVEVRMGYKYYGSKSNPKIILNYLNMNVMRGSIYGLLGASGCGKTTLLSCIVGQRQLNSGEINVLGLKPGIPGSGIPGARIGYMPQDIALVDEMTVKEMLFYFGRIYGLSDEQIGDKFRLLRELLELPRSKQLIKNCSGGQQRRISFACAMIHDPELLILDEPTVGLDPMLREKIWDFLVQATKTSKMAVIITTHYIEEAKQANCIGLMRNGVLLAEDTPQNIMIKFESDSIEDAFLKLSQKQGDADAIFDNPKQTPPQEMMSSVEVVDTIPGTNNNHCEKPPLEYNSDFQPVDANGKKIWFTTKGRTKALMTKNFVQLFRQPSGIIFMLLFPIIQLSCFYLAIGKTPANLKIGVVNSEMDYYRRCFDSDLRTVYLKNETCYFNKISCRYILELGDDIVKRKFYETEKEALKAAKKAEIVGYLHFPHNFSQSIQAILDEGRFAEEGSLVNAEMTVHMDMTDQQIAFFVERKLRDKFGQFMRNILATCNLPVGLADLPVNFQDPIYGSFDIEFQQYVAPGVVMTMVFFLATLMTAAVFISERMDGVWDRTLVAGISAGEMLWAHLLTQFIIMAFQSFEIITFIGIVFDTYNKGSTTTLVFLLTLTAFCGMLFGLLISVYCKSNTEANFVATGAFYPMIILCGLLWPLEGMPEVMQDAVKFLPFTIPAISARNVIEKGWKITNVEVYNGFIVMGAWIVIFFICCLLGIKRKG